MREFESCQLPDGNYEIKIDGVKLPDSYPAEEVGKVYAEHWAGEVKEEK